MDRKNTPAQDEIAFITWEAHNASKLEVECHGVTNIAKGDFPFLSSKIWYESQTQYTAPTSWPKDAYPAWFHPGTSGTETCTLYPVNSDGTAGIPRSISITIKSDSSCVKTCFGDGLFCENSQPQNATAVTNKECCGGSCYQCSAGYVWSADSGFDFNKDWKALAMSSDGAMRLISAYQDYAYLSSDYGNKWNVKSDLGKRKWLSAAMSSNGKYVAVNCSDGCFTSHDSGVTWDSGSPGWRILDFSNDGKVQVANADHRTKISTDYGVNWNDASMNFSNVKVSYDGSIQIAYAHASNVYESKIYVSTDYGNNWSQASPSSYWNDVAISDDGKFQTAVSVNSVKGSSGSGEIYTSDDYGKNWSLREIGGYHTWLSIAMSSNGQYQSAVAIRGSIYTSSDYGKSWTPSSFPKDGNWYGGTKISGDGKNQVALAAVGGSYLPNLKGGMYVSDDFGKTWTSRETSGACVSTMSQMSESSASCGTANGKNFSYLEKNWGSYTFCAQGTADPVSPVFPDQGAKVSWKCQSSTGATVECSAKRDAKICKPDDPNCAARTCKDRYCWNGCELVRGTSNDCD